MTNLEKGLSKIAITGAKWTSLSQFSKQVIQYITTLILAVLLSPDDFGVIALASMIIGFLDIFKDLGSSSAIIYFEKINEKVLSSIFWVNVLFGATISLLIFLSSSLLANYFNSDILESILKTLSISFLISSLSIVQKSYLEKSFKFEKLAMIETVSILFGAIVGISSALYGLGVWSLVIQVFTTNIILTLGYWLISDWKPNFILNISAIKPVLNYSVNLTGYNIFNYFVRNADYFLIGKFVGENALGHYFLAYKIMLYPLQNISRVVSRVMFPIYSKIKNDNKKFKDIYTDIAKLIAIISFPIMIIIIGFRFEITHLFFSTKWDELLLSQLLVILAPIGIIQSIATTTGSIYQSKGRTDWMFKWGVFSGILYVGGFLLGIKWGVLGVAISYLVVTYVLVYLVFSIPFKLIDFSVNRFFQKLFRIVFINLGLLLVFILLKNLFYLFTNNLIFVLFFSLIVGLLIYVLTIKKYENKLISFFLDKL